MESDVERLLEEVGKISRVFDESPELFDAKFTVKNETLNRLTFISDLNSDDLCLNFLL